MCAGAVEADKCSKLRGGPLRRRGTAIAALVISVRLGDLKELCPRFWVDLPHARHSDSE